MMRSSGQNCNAEMKRRSRDELRATPAPGALTPPRAPLIPKLRGYVAEFLHQRSLERLRIFISPTCVSFSTGGLHQPIAAFLVSTSDDFGIVNVLALSGRPCLAGRSPSMKFHANRP